MDNVKKLARRFMREYRLRHKKLTLKTMQDITGKLGFQIIYYSPSYNSPDVEALLRSFHKFEYAQSVNSFIYVDEHKRLIFIRKFLSEQDQLILLCHEIGHIYGEHLYSTSIASNSDVAKEEEAHLFSRYIRNYRKNSLIQYATTIATGVVIIIAVGIAASFLSSAGKDGRIPANANAPQQYIEQEGAVDSVFSEAAGSSISQKHVWITDSGQRYHNPWCMYVEGRNNTRELTIQEAQEAGRTPCLICRPDKQD